MLSLFNVLYKTLYNYNLGQIVLLKNREILIDGKPIFTDPRVVVKRDHFDEGGKGYFRDS